MCQSVSSSVMDFRLGRACGTITALVVCSMLVVSCDLFQSGEQTAHDQAPETAAHETATPVGTEELFFGEVSGFTPPPPTGGGDATVPALAQTAKAEDGVHAQETKPTFASRYHGPWSPEERIVESDTIARAWLRSAYVGAAYSHEERGERHYRPVVEFVYEVSEYLKGNGSDEIAVATSFFGNPTSVSRTSALNRARSTAERMTNHMIKDIESAPNCDEPSVEGIRRSGRCLQVWEIGDNVLYGEEWLIFMLQDKPYPSVVPETGRAQRSEYAFIGEGRQGSPYQAVWMPSVASVSEDDALSDEWYFTTGPFAGRPWQSIFALSDVRKSVAEIDALLDSGVEIADYKYCLSWMYYEKRVADWDMLHYGRVYTDDEIAKLREWVTDEGCAEAMSAVGLLEKLGN
ncbi:MAG: hypothetical protein F4Y44_03875 [Chloroflexi bacterium]|nr:hypothetical protein [Chloroflexota bacterium]